MNKKFLVCGSIALGIVFIILAIIYFSHPAGSLPSFFPGYQAGSAHVHIKHGVASVILAAALFIFAWFQSGKKTS